MKLHTRRTFFRGMTAGAVALPFIRTLTGRNAHAAAAPRRLVVFATGNGTVMDEYWPGAGCAFKEILRPLEPWKSKLLVLRGIDMKTAYKEPVPKDHLPDYPNLLTGRQPSGTDYSDLQMSGISLDQELAKAVGSATRFGVLNLGNQLTTSAYPLIASGPGRPIGSELSPFRAFDRVFADVAGEVTALEKLRTERRSILDLVGQELSTIRCELGASDRPRFDAHVDAVRELERSLAFTGGDAPACQPKAPGTSFDVDANENFPKVGQLQMDIIVNALRCDRTRIATLQWSDGASSTRHDWVGVPYKHHGVSHNSEGVSADEGTRNGWLVKIENWYAQQFAYLLRALDTIPEDTGTMLDNTVVWWAHEQSDGGGHRRTDMPFVLAGGKGFFRTGRCLDLGGRDHNALLVSLANYMGHPITQFGDPDFASGPIAELR